MSSVMQIKAKFDSTCMSCEEPIHEGDMIWWAPGVGAWHVDCKDPRSLDHYNRSAKKRKESGR